MIKKYRTLWIFGIGIIFTFAVLSRWFIQCAEGHAKGDILVPQKNKVIHSEIDSHIAAEQALNLLDSTAITKETIPPPIMVAPDRNQNGSKVPAIEDIVVPIVKNKVNAEDVSDEIIPNSVEGEKFYNINKNKKNYEKHDQDDVLKNIMIDASIKITTKTSNLPDWILLSSNELKQSARVKSNEHGEMTINLGDRLSHNGIVVNIGQNYIDIQQENGSLTRLMASL